MSLIKANAVQIGQSGTATQNFTLAVPSSPDGTIKLARGNAGATTQDVISVDASGNINGLVKSTGSTTARSLANRFADVINVKDFGAVGNGTDDRTAFISAANAAIAAAKQLVIPSGSYFISGPLIQANGLYVICYGDITGPSVFVENGCCFYGDNCYFYKQSDYQDILHFSNWNVDASSRAQHTTLGLAQRYDGQANINSYFGSGNPLHCYLHYGEGRKSAGQKASGTAGAVAGQVNVFSLDNGTGIGRTEIQGLAAVTVAPDALLGASTITMNFR